MKIITTAKTEFEWHKESIKDTCNNPLSELILFNVSTCAFNHAGRITATRTSNKITQK